MECVHIVLGALEMYDDDLAAGRNVGLKSGGYQFRRRTRRSLVPRRMGRKYPPLFI